MSPAERKKPRVLVVDDCIEMAESVADGLVDRGFDAVAETASETAFVRLGEERVDALVTDLRMPRVDGLTLLARSRALDPSRPVIVMTAFSAIDGAVDAIHKGAACCLVKPFKLEELVVALRRSLRNERGDE